MSAADSLAEAVRAADHQIGTAQTQITIARAKLAAAEKKYQERMKGRPGPHR
jgi:hypothetical protein